MGHLSPQRVREVDLAFPCDADVYAIGSKKKAKKDECKQKEIGDNPGMPPLYGISPADLLTCRSRAEKTLEEEDQEDHGDCSYWFKLYGASGDQ